MSSRPALAASILAIALVMAVAPVAVAPVGDRVLADVPAGLRADRAGASCAGARVGHPGHPALAVPDGASGAVHRAAATLAGSGAPAGDRVPVTPRRHERQDRATRPRGTA